MGWRTRGLVEGALLLVIMVIMAGLVACAGPVATVDAPALPPARTVAEQRPLLASCPPDAPWTGTICMGQGYVTCPGGSRLIDQTCLGAPDAGPDARAPSGRRHADATAPEDDPQSSEHDSDED